MRNVWSLDTESDYHPFETVRTEFTPMENSNSILVQNPNLHYNDQQLTGIMYWGR